MEENKKHSGAKTAFHDIGEKIEDVSKLKTTKRIADFCPEESASIKSFAAKEKQEVHVTTRFFVWKNVDVCEAFSYELYPQAAGNVLFSRQKSKKKLRNVLDRKCVHVPHFNRH